MSMTLVNQHCIVNLWIRCVVCCSVLQCVAACCSVYDARQSTLYREFMDQVCGVLQCVAVCCSVLQCVAVCSGVLQCVAACCSVYDARQSTLYCEFMD